MTRALIGAKSGWGKGWTTQKWVIDNLPKYSGMLFLDYKDEYRGIPEAGLAKWCGIGQAETRFSESQWADILTTNPRLVCARSVGLDDWRQFCATVISAARSLRRDMIVVVDEAHFVAPQGEGYPDEIRGLATTGRGEGVSSAWVSQRFQMLDETMISQATCRLLGGFGSDRDINKIRGNIPYNADVHDINEPNPGGRWDDPLERYPAEKGIEGSEWIYSDDGGDIRRIDTRDWVMDANHYGGDDVTMDPPGA